MTDLNPSSDLGILKELLPPDSIVKLERSSHSRKWEVTIRTAIGGIEAKIVASADTLHDALGEVYDLALDLMHNAERPGEKSLQSRISPTRHDEPSDPHADR